MERKMICISCPMGCHLIVVREESDPGDNDNIHVEGNQCSRGEIYGREEILEPKRVLTATCRVRSSLMGRIPVKTTQPLLKSKIIPLLQKLYELEITAPVKMGDVLVSNFENTGVDVITTRSLSD